MKVWGQLERAQVEILGSDPSTTALIGRVWYNSASNLLKVMDNASTVQTVLFADIGAIDDADISASAAIAGTKISPNFGSQNVTTTGTLAGSNFSGTSSGTNSGDITLAAVGSSPAANGASLSSQVLTLQPADATHPGVISTASQTMGSGTKFFSGQVGLSSSSVDSRMLVDIGNGANVLTGTTQIAFRSNFTATSAATSLVEGGFFNCTTAASTTVAIALALEVGGITRGAGGTITNAMSLLIDGTSVGTNNAFVADVTNWTGNWNLYFATTNASYHGGRIAFGAPSVDSTSFIVIDNLQTQTLLTGTSQNGVSSYLAGNSNATSTIAGFKSSPATQASAFTAVNLTAYEIGTLTKGAGSTITYATGMWGATPTVGTNNAFAADNNSYSGSYGLNLSTTNPSFFKGGIQLGTAGTPTNYALSTLSQYSVGTYTPTVTPTTGTASSVVVNQAKYVLVGKICTVSVYLTWTQNTSNATTTQISLPFTPDSGENGVFKGLFYVTINAAVNTFAPYIQTSTPGVNLAFPLVSGVQTSFTAGGSISASGTISYIVA